VIEKEPMLNPIPSSPLHALAIAFLQQHEGEHLVPHQDRLVTRCAHYLIDRDAALSLDVARDVARQALGELTSRSCSAYINLDLTTSYALFINDADGSKQCYSLRELLRVIRQAEAGAL
jgi:hypothetical protein